MQSVDSYRAERQWWSARARPGQPNIECAISAFRTRMTDSQGDSLRLFSRPMMQRSMGAPRRRCAAVSASSSMVQWRVGVQSHPSAQDRVRRSREQQRAWSRQAVSAGCQTQLGGCTQGVAADEQACSVRAWVALTESGEDRVWNRLRQPPASKLGGGEVREGRTRRKHQTPGSKLVGQSAGFVISHVEAI